MIDSVSYHLKGVHQARALEGQESDSGASQGYETLPIVRLSSKDFVGLPSAFRALIGGFVSSQTGLEVRYFAVQFRLLILRLCIITVQDLGRQEATE